ncbi:MAG TPA: MBL fold metallo-hydrolase [Candidatus Acidoferrum sp.]|nr:MBL fold metallo-hydrolase [Candidatus Acidoferrum sp.]
MAISHIFETHIHADHVSGARELSSQTGSPIYLGPQADVEYAHISAAEGQQIEVGNRRLRAHAGTYLPARG